MLEYDPKFWKHGENMTVGQFCDYVRKHIPLDAILHVCGDSQVYLHFSPEGNAFSLDYDSLSGLPEYGDCKVEELGSGEVT